MAPCWLNASHHILQTSMRHIIDLFFFQCLIYILKNLHKMKLIMFCHVVMFQKLKCYHILIVILLFYVHIEKMLTSIII